MCQLNQVAPRRSSCYVLRVMFARAGLAILAVAAAWGIFPMHASAQITTGSVSGTVRDVQGAVIPGAVVALISETRGTRTAEVFTNQNGDFVFVNVSPDRYTAQVNLSGFKSLELSGLALPAGDRLR